MSTNQNKNQNHNFFMNLALKEAEKNLGNTKENPAVGCVIARNKHLLSVGRTSFNGRPHAEHNAIVNSRKKISNANLYVTLEPCSHFGKTPPCVQKIIKSKIKKVFFSISDPDPRSYNRSLKSFKRFKVKINKGINSNKIKNFYKSYFLFKKKKLPFVTCKIAASKDLFTISNKKKMDYKYLF